MKRLTHITLGILVVFLMAVDVQAQKISSGTFDKIKKLEGKWKGVKPNGQIIEVTFESTSGGSAVVETMMPEGEPNMVSVYYMDGDTLMMTHYCSAGNQPRMKASATEDGNLDFNFLDATNLKNKSEGHMQGLKVVFLDKNHFNQVWNWTEEGEEMPSTFEYEKVM